MTFFFGARSVPLRSVRTAVLRVGPFQGAPGRDGRCGLGFLFGVIAARANGARTLVRRKMGWQVLRLGIAEMLTSRFVDVVFS